MSHTRISLELLTTAHELNKRGEAQSGRLMQHLTSLMAHEHLVAGDAAHALQLLEAVASGCLRCPSNRLPLNQIPAHQLEPLCCIQHRLDALFAHIAGSTSLQRCTMLQTMFGCSCRSCLGLTTSYNTCCRACCDEVHAGPKKGSSCASPPHPGLECLHWSDVPSACPHVGQSP